MLRVNKLHELIPATFSNEGLQTPGERPASKVGQKQEPKVSLLQIDVFSVLKVLEIDPETSLEYQAVAANNFRVDIYIPRLRLVVEVNGNSHYADGARLLNMKSRYRLGLLLDSGFGVLTVHHAQWSQLKGLGQKMQFLSGYLELCLRKEQDI